MKGATVKVAILSFFSQLAKNFATMTRQSSKILRCREVGMSTIIKNKFSPEKSWHPIGDVNKAVTDISRLLGQVRCMHKCHSSSASLEKGAFGAPEI